MTPASDRGQWRWHVGVLAVYTVLALVFIDHGISLTQNILGTGSDPFAFIWFLAWWPWAISHHIYPLYTNLVWQPLGVQLAWVTSVPLLSLIGLPVTLLAGPVLTFNLLIICAPVLSAWMAYILCLRITGNSLAAVIGGFLFGFSSYEMGQDSAALNLSFTMLVPTLLLIVLMRLDNELTRGKVVFWAGLVLISQFLNSIEIFALIFIFGGIAWLLALLYLPARRGVLQRLFLDGLLIAPILLLAVSPFLWVMLQHLSFVHLPAAWPYFFTADFMNVFVPDTMKLLGGNFFGFVSHNFKGGVQERDAYIGIPLLLILFLYAKEERRTAAGRFLLVVFLVLIISSFGPRLWIDGHYSPIVLPWMIFVHLPLISSALPARFALFVSLIAAIIAALWLAGPVPSKTRRWRQALGFLACITLLPRLHPYMKIPHSVFFQPGRVEAVLGPRPRIMILPFAINGPSSFWQEESNFSFAQTGGYLGFPPAAMQHFNAVGQLFGGMQGANFLNDFVEFATATNTQYIVAGPGTSASLLAQLGHLNWPEKKVDDVIIFTVPASKPDSAAHG